jgi:NAD(P)-dependent dehydrogenase (short-subunit alcohol dehydrogenase family)/ketosteroid isomerase-like protein
MALIIRRIGVILVFAGFSTIGFSGGAIAAGNGTQKAMLVTGASTGIGRKITEVLAANGYFVYAGARKQADMDVLNAIDNVEAIALDVTVQEQIDAAVATVEQSGRGLYGLINNAGVYIGGPVVDVPVEELQWLMDVNVFGVYRVTQAFAPLIIESGGRISTIGSISGIGSGRFSSHYSMSKHAIEAFTDSLAAEIEPLGVKVSVIEPGNYDSAIGDSALARMKSKNAAYAKGGSPFAEAYQEWLDRDWDRGKYKAPDEVAEAAMHAMSDPAPLRRYMVVPDEGAADWTISKQIEELVQLNQWQAYSYSREELIAKMDAVPPSDTAEVELTAMLHSFLQNTGAEAAHAKFWADDLVYTSSNGTRFGKTEIMQSFAGKDGSEAADIVYSGEDVSVRVFGTTAVVTFRLVGTPNDGSASSQYFNSGTFLKRQGAWRAVSWQATTIPAEPQS